MRPAVVTVSERSSWRPAGDERLPPSAATDDRLHDAARFVISPDGHADDARLQAAFKLLRAEAPVLWVDTPGMRPSGCSAATATSRSGRRGAPPLPAHFPHQQNDRGAPQRMLGQPYVLRGLLQMTIEHAAYCAIARPSLRRPPPEMEPWLGNGRTTSSAVSPAAPTLSTSRGNRGAVSIRGIMRLLAFQADDDLILKLSGLVGPEDPVRGWPITRPRRLQAGPGFQAISTRRRRPPRLSRHDLRASLPMPRCRARPCPTTSGSPTTP